LTDQSHFVICKHMAATQNSSKRREIEILCGNDIDIMRYLGE
jgi:hypothetical protein